MLDFTEIPKAHEACGQQDRFEQFARDFLVALGFTLVDDPGRGADQGRDLLVEERVPGILAECSRRWLVSVKHKAHSGRAVSNQDEPDPFGRVRAFRADGFLAFYSTIPTSALLTTLGSLRAQGMLYEILDAARIEGHLLDRSALRPLLRQYFPESYERRFGSRSPATVAQQFKRDLTAAHTEEEQVASIHRALDSDLPPAAVITAVNEYYAGMVLPEVLAALIARAFAAAEVTPNSSPPRSRSQQPRSRVIRTTPNRA